MKKHSKYSLATILFCAQMASAYAGQNQGLPWEGPLDKLADFFTGPFAKSISLIAIVICFGILIFGGELNDFAKKAIYVVIGVAGVVGASSLLTNLFGGSGSVLGF